MHLFSSYSPLMAPLSRSFLRLAFSVLLLFFHFKLANSATCSSQQFSNNRVYKHCNDLPPLSSYLHWTFDPAQSTLSIAFIAPAMPDGWVAWALNPTQEGMIGAQSLIAFKDSKGGMTVKTYNISSYASIQESKVWFDVKEATAESSDGVIRLFATLGLPKTVKTTVNHVWQVGSSVVDGVPARHDLQQQNLNSKGSLDLLNGQSNTIGGSVDSRTKRKNIHGILNVVGWGILFPIGVLIARFLRQIDGLDPAWFYLHAGCQISAYAIGVAGWATGLKLGSQSKGIQYSAHRNIGISLFSLATIQMFALFLRPKKDHKYRFYWNIYHHGIGYTIIGLSLWNIFKGLDILHPENKWRHAYNIYLIALAVFVTLVQGITWFLAFRRKSRKSTKPYGGYGDEQGRQQPF